MTYVSLDLVLKSSIIARNLDGRILAASTRKNHNCRSQKRRDDGYQNVFCCLLFLKNIGR